MGKSIAELQREVARLKGKLRAQTERGHLKHEKHRLRHATSRKVRFADLVKEQFKKKGKMTFKEAIKAAKREYRTLRR